MHAPSCGVKPNLKIWMSAAAIACGTLSVAGLVGCAPSGDSQGSSAQPPPPPPTFVELKTKHAEEVDKIREKLEPAQFEKALRFFSQVMLRRDPRPEEITLARTGSSGYSQAIDNMLNSNEFKDSQRAYYQNLFEMTGTSSGVNFDEPTNLAMFLVNSNSDFRRILTETTCYDNNLQPIACSAFASTTLAAAQAAGVITTKAFLVKWSTAFNFRRAKKTFETFACTSYPDTSDSGMTQDEIASNVKAFNSTTAVPNCYACHATLNARTAPFYQFDRLGVYNLNPTAAVAAVTDTGAVSTALDLLKTGVKPRYHGQEIATVRDYALKLSSSVKFRNCVAQRLINQMLAQKADKKIPAEMQDIRDNIESNGFVVKKIIADIAKHPSFINR